MIAKLLLVALSTITYSGPVTQLQTKLEPKAFYKDRYSTKYATISCNLSLKEIKFNKISLSLKNIYISKHTFTSMPIKGIVSVYENELISSL